MAKSKAVTNGNRNGNGKSTTAVQHHKNRLLTATLKIMETWYGLIVLVGFIVTMFRESKKFRVMDSIDKKELSDGKINC